MPALGSASWHVWRGYISIKVGSDHVAEQASNDDDVSIVLVKLPTTGFPDRGSPGEAMPQKRRSLYSLRRFALDGLTRKGES